MKTIINITNHNLTMEQTAGFDEVVEMPAELKSAWSQVGPTEGEVDEVATNIYNWLRKKFYKNTCHQIRVAVQGHFGATFQVVEKIKKEREILERGMMPENPPRKEYISCVYASSIRESVEEKQKDGSTIKKAVFRHITWNRY